MRVLCEPRIAGLALPLGKLSFRLVLGHTVALLDLAGELVTVAGDDVDVVIGEFAPLLLRLARDLFPVALNAVPVHMTILRLFVEEYVCVPDAVKTRRAAPHRLCGSAPGGRLCSTAH